MILTRRHAFLTLLGAVAAGLPQRCLPPRQCLCRLDTAGRKPASLPVGSAAKIELAINLKTAKAPGLEVTHTLIAAADTVIQ